MNTKKTGFYYIKTLKPIDYKSDMFPENEWHLDAGSIVIATVEIETEPDPEFAALGLRKIADVPNQTNPRLATVALYSYENSGTKEFEVLGEVPSCGEYIELVEDAKAAEQYELGNPENEIGFFLENLAQQISVYGKSPAEVLDDVFREHKIFCEMREVA